MKNCISISFLFVVVLFSPIAAKIQGIYSKKWIWEVGDTKTGKLEDGQIILRACWDISPTIIIPGPKNVAAWKSTVEAHIKTQWNGYSRTKFVFDGSPCDFTIGHEDLRFEPKTNNKVEWSPNAMLGKTAANQSVPAMWLCWSFKNYRPGAVGRVSGKVVKYDPEYHEKVILTQATHEFGHILGLLHDQESPDKPKTCTAKVNPDVGQYDPIGVYDSSSIMNYCNLNYWYSRQNTPSCGDISTIRIMYGMNPNYNLEPDCRMSCASGINGDNLTKTGAALAACEFPDRIIGNLSNVEDRLFYPDEQQYGGDNNGVTIGDSVIVPDRRGYNANVVATVTEGSNSSLWKVKLEALNTGVIWSSTVKMYYFGVYDEIQKGFIYKILYHDAYASPKLPQTYDIPKASGMASVPSGYSFSVTKAYPKKVLVKTYAYGVAGFGWWNCIWDGCYHIGEIRVNLSYPQPQSFEYFNSIDSNTVIDRKKMVVIPRKQSGNPSKPFLMDKYEVTQKDYMAIMREFPMAWPGKVEQPVENITMFDAIIYCNKRSKIEGLSAVYKYTYAELDTNGNCVSLQNLTADNNRNGYRLPTVVEWNWAYYGKANSNFPWGSSATDGWQYGWASAGSNTHPHSKGLKLPTNWGLYDIFGNVREWAYQEGLSPRIMGSAYNDGMNQWYDGNESASPNIRKPSVGFRTVRKYIGINPVVNLLLN